MCVCGCLGGVVGETGILSRGLCFQAGLPWANWEHLDFGPRMKEGEGGGVR